MKPTDVNPPPNQGHDLSLQNLVSTAISRVDLSPMAGDSSIPSYQLRSPNQSVTREYLIDMIQEALDILEEDADRLDNTPPG
jgi:hypothetical protein